MIIYVLYVVKKRKYADGNRKSLLFMSCMWKV